MPDSADRLSQEGRDAVAHEAMDRVLRALAEDAAGAMSEHPETEALVAYQEGRLAEEAAAEVQRHLAVCRSCAEEVLRLASFDEEVPADSDLLPTAEVTREDWATFQVLAAEGARSPGSEPATELRPFRPAPTRTPRRHGWLIAAALPVAAGVGFWIAVAVTGPAGGNPFVFNLVPDGSRPSREAVSVPEVEVPPGMDPLVPRLHLGSQAAYQSFRAEIADAAGHTVWHQVGLLRQPAGDFNLIVPRKHLKADRYRLRLLGERNGEETELAVYTFDLRYASPRDP